MEIEILSNGETTKSNILLMHVWLNNYLLHHYDHIIIVLMRFYQCINNNVAQLLFDIWFDAVPI